MKNRIKVIYIAGMARCGSTILSKALCQNKTFFNSGELAHIWDRGFQRNWPCSCGVNFKDCKVWNEIVEKSCANLKDDDISNFASLIGFRSNKKHIFKIGIYLNPKRYLNRLFSSINEYKWQVEKIYSAIKENNAIEVVVDSSKDPYYGYLISQFANLDVYTLHLVRDPRAILYSHINRRKKILGSENKKMGGGNIFSLTLNWCFSNIMIRRILGNKNYLLVKYEEFANNPQKTIKNIYKFIGESVEDINFIEKNIIRVQPGHIFSGNPNRKEVGKLEIKTDDEWKSKMPFLKKKIIKFLTYPIYRKYYLNNR